MTDLEQLRKLAVAKRAIRQQVNELNAYMREVDQRIVELIDPKVNCRMSTGSGFADRVSLYRSSRTVVDHDAMRGDGIDVDAYTTTTEAAHFSVRVEQR